MNTYRYTANAKPNMQATLHAIDSPKVRLILAGIAFVCMVMYVFQTSALATRGYVINDLEKQLHTLSTEQKKIDVEIAEYKSLQHIETQLAETNLVPVTEVQYIAGDTSVARR